MKITSLIPLSYNNLINFDVLLIRQFGAEPLLSFGEAWDRYVKITELDTVMFIVVVE